MILGAAHASCESPPADRPALEVIVSPEAGARDVDTNVVPAATFSVPVDPRLVGSDLIRLRSGELWPTGTPGYSVVDRRATFTPSVSLRGGLAYRVVLREDLRGIDGSRPAGAVDVTFTTGVTGTERPAVPPAPDYDRDIAPLLAARCASCHSGTRPAGNVALETRADSDALGERISGQWPGWRLVVPGAPEWSYVMYKITDGPGIVGDAMPPGAPLTIDEARTIERWIAAGADANAE